MKINCTAEEGENRMNCVRARKWVRDIKEGLDKEKKWTQKKGEGVKEAKVRGPHSFLGAHK